MAGYDAVSAERFAGFDLRLLLFSNFATVHPKLLPIYAEFYGIANFVQTERQTRDLLSRTIALYRKKGTPWAMKQILAILGYPDVTIIEGGAVGAQILYDGAINYDGQYQHGGGNWANFTVVVHLNGTPTPNAAAVAALEYVIEDFKPARCKLLALDFD